jgi:hypothetical protein
MVDLQAHIYRWRLAVLGGWSSRVQSAGNRAGAMHLAKGRGSNLQPGNRVALRVT